MKHDGGSMQDRFGKVVAKIRLIGDDLGSYVAPRDCTMTCEQSFHGDHDEVWIVARAADGAEWKRWNARAIAEIVWA